MKISNAIEIACREEAREDAERHARNLEAWYARNEGSAPATTSELTSIGPMPIFKPKLAIARAPNPRSQALRPTPPLPLLAANSTQKKAGPLDRGWNTTVISETKPPCTLPPKSLPLRPNPRTSSLGKPGKVRKTSTEVQLAVAVPGDFFMFYRDPPPWSSLHSAINAIRLQQLRRNEKMKSTVVMRTSEFASVDRTSTHASMARRQLDNLLPKREQLRHDFGLTSSAPVSQGSSRNPFLRKRARSPDLAAFASTSNTVSSVTPPLKKESLRRMPTACTFGSTPTWSEDSQTPGTSCSASAPTRGMKNLKPISTVPTPVFTQDLLDATAKESKKASSTDEGLKRSLSSSSTSKPVKRRAKASPSDPPQQTGFDWKSWASHLRK